MEELVAGSDHIVIGKITKVTMHNWIGWETKNPKARTRPGSKNELRLHVTLAEDGILKTNKKEFPQKFVIPLWKMWHYSLEGVKTDEGEFYIFLLVGDKMERVYPRYFKRGLDERESIEALINL